jgi:hypothetical protein
MPTAPFRRIVTGHDEKGNAIIQEDGPPPRAAHIGGEHGPVFYEVWNTQETPARIDRAGGEPPEQGLQLVPPKNGTRIRVLDIPPEGDWLEGMSAEEIKAHFAEVGASDAASGSDTGSPHALMHRTETVDYGIVLEGEMTLVMDIGSGKNCRIAFVLIDGKYTDGLA